MVRTSSQQSKVIRLAGQASCPTPGPDRLSVLLVVVFPSTAPPFPVLVPLTAIFVLPAGPLLRMPFAPVLRGPVIVAHRYAQKWRRDELGCHADPGAVVARADVPAAIGEGVALPVVLV